MMMTMMRMAKQNRRFCVWRTKSYHDDDDDDDDDDGGGGGNENEIDDYDGDDEGDNNGEYGDNKDDENDNDDDDEDDEGDAFCQKFIISCCKLPCVNDSPSCTETVSLNAAGISTRS